MPHRRSFVVGLGSAVAAAPLLAVPSAGAGRVSLGPSYIVNMADQAPLEGLSLQAGQPLALRRQPDRAFDPNSIAVLQGDRRLGYLPANQSKLLARLLDGGFTIGADLLDITWQPRPSARLEIYLG